MAGVSGDISVRLNLVQTGSSDLGTPRLPVTVDSFLTLSSGTDAVNKANILFADTRTLAASASENIDLAGVLTDAFGATISAAEIVAIYIKASAANTNSVVVGAATQPFAGPLGAAGTYSVKPGEYYLAASQSGWPVGAGATDNLKVLNGGAGTSVTYDIIVVGRTVAA